MKIIEHLLEKGVEVTSHGAVLLLYRRLPPSNDKKHEIPVMEADLRFVIWIRDLPNMKHKRYPLNRDVLPVNVLCLR